MHCLYQVFNDVTCTDDDLLTILTCVCGKMARDMETNCPNSPHYDKAKSAACVYHRLSKDIYLQPKEIKRERKRQEEGKEEEKSGGGERDIYEFNNIALSDDDVSLGFYLLTLWSDF